MAINRVSVTLKTIASVCGVKHTIQQPPVVQTIYPGPMVHPAIVIVFGAKKENAYLGWDMYVKSLTEVGVPGVRGVSVV